MFLEREILNPNNKFFFVKTIHSPKPFSLFIKGEWDFSKIAVMEGNKNFLLEFGGKPGMVSWFYNGDGGRGGMENFLKSFA